MTKPGEQVGAFLSFEDGVMRFLGFGVYQGKLQTPRPMGFTASILPEEINTWPLAEKYYQNEMGMPEITLEQLPTSNPCILLDSGDTVWGAECWWGPKAKIQRMLDTAEEVIHVDPKTVDKLQASSPDE